MVLGLLYIPLKHLGYGITWKELIILFYGGLRGAICMSLALIVKADPDVSERFKNLVMLFCNGMVVLTLLINGSTCGLVVKKIGMI